MDQKVMSRDRRKARMDEAMQQTGGWVSSRRSGVSRLFIAVRHRIEKEKGRYT